jgi:hypothetical protein
MLVGRLHSRYYCDMISSYLSRYHISFRAIYIVELTKEEGEMTEQGSYGRDSYLCIDEYASSVFSPCRVPIHPSVGQ